MLEVLQFILSSPANFFGTLALIFTTGISIGVALHPFGQPRNFDIYECDGDDYEAEDQDQVSYRH